MRRKFAALLALGAAAFAIAECAQVVPPGPESVPPGYAPYDPVTNPFCGALGNCEPLIKRPYPIAPNYYN